MGSQTFQSLTDLLKVSETFSRFPRKSVAGCPLVTLRETSYLCRSAASLEEVWEEHFIRRALMGTESYGGD